MPISWKLLHKWPWFKGWTTSATVTHAITYQKKSYAALPLTSLERIRYLTSRPLNTASVWESNSLAGVTVVAPAEKRWQDQQTLRELLIKLIIMEKKKGQNALTGKWTRTDYSVPVSSTETHDGPQSSMLVLRLRAGYLIKIQPLFNKTAS